MAFTPLLVLLATNAFAVPRPAATESPAFSKEQTQALKKDGLNSDLLNPEFAGNIGALVSKDDPDYLAFQAWANEPSMIVAADGVGWRGQDLDEQIARISKFADPKKLEEVRGVLVSHRKLAGRDISAPLPAGGDRQAAAPTPSSSFSLMTSASLSSPTGLLSSDFKGGMTSLRLSPVPLSLSPVAPAAAPNDFGGWLNSYYCRYVPEKCVR